MCSEAFKTLSLLLAAGCVTYAPAPKCTTDADCPVWHCECGDGVADARYCNADHCAIAEGVCGTTCRARGSCWWGRASGGWANGNSVGQTGCTGNERDSGAKCGDDDFADLGAPCATAGDCASGLCIGNGASFVCAKRCSSNAQCPAGWVCGTNPEGLTTCFIGAPEDEGKPVSTNAACAQVGFTDIGMICTVGSDCQSNICFGSSLKGFVCSRRCNDDSLCAAGFKCVTSAGDSARFCEKQ